MTFGGNEEAGLLAGEHFAGYTILRLLGSGGMGEVYLAQHPRLPRLDALKLLGRAISSDAEFRERFLREADLAAGLWHPHVVGVHDRGEYRGQLWISMDYVEGTDAAELMSHRYPAGMPADEVTKIITAIGSALDYAHQRGLLHRDVKPANILISNSKDGEGRILLGDFGIARRVSEVSGLTATNLTVGTVTYAAPEQLMGERLDGRADQYALAATAFHLLTGTPLFTNSNPIAVISKHLTSPPPKISSLRPDLVALDGVFVKALSKEPSLRFPSCSEFAVNLRDGVGHLKADASLVTQASITAPPIEKTPRKRNWVSSHFVSLATVLVALTAMVAVGAIAYLKTDDEPRQPDTAAKPPLGATLNGTYRLAYKWSTRMINGEKAATPLADQSGSYAFRSDCVPTGCVATAISVDDADMQKVSSPPVIAVWRFTGKSWERLPKREQAQEEKCFTIGGEVASGTDTEISQWWLEPQPDGTLSGTYRGTITTNECGFAGLVTEADLIATRIGDAPPGIELPDPTEIDSALPPAPPPSPPGSPVLDGAYRVELDGSAQTINARPFGGVPNSTRWYAYRSLCRATRCIAAGTTIEKDLKTPTGGADVFEFRNGQWETDQQAVRTPCPVGDGDALVVVTSSLAPQTDGTLRGYLTITALSNECGNQGNVYRTPQTAVRVGDIPPAAVTADPALFLY